MLKNDQTGVPKHLELTAVGDDAKGIHDHVLGLLPVEGEKHEMWFNATLSGNECIADAGVLCNKGNSNENANVVDDVGPYDSFSNIGVHKSQEPQKWQVQHICAEKAALIERAAA